MNGIHVVAFVDVNHMQKDENHKKYERWITSVEKRQQLPSGFRV